MQTTVPHSPHHKLSTDFFVKGGHHHSTPGFEGNCSYLKMPSSAQIGDGFLLSRLPTGNKACHFILGIF